MKKNIIVITCFALFLNIYFFRHIGSLGLAISVAGTTLAMLLISYKEASRKLRWYIEGLGLLHVILLAISVFRANPFVGAISVLIGLLLSMLTLYSLQVKRIYLSGVLEVISIPLHLLGSYIQASFENLKLISGGKIVGLLGGKDSILRVGKIPMVVGGIFIGIPVAWIILSLLLSADPIFAASMKNILSVITIDRFIGRLILTSIGILFILPFIRLRINTSYSLSVKKFQQPSLIPVIATVLVMVGMVLGAFIFIQWPYIFVRVSHEMDLSKYGVSTYSEYTKKGFGELLVVTGIVYALLWLSHIIGRKYDLVNRKALVGIELLLTSELFIFMASVLRRVRLYWNFHGLSLIRIYGSVLVLLFAVFTFTLMLRYFTRKIRFVTVELLTVIICVLVLGIWNEEAYIVKNHPPTVNGVVDSVYLSRLSADGYEGWRTAYDYATTTINRYGSYSGSSLTPQVRKELSYSGMILSMLAKRYQMYILQYAGMKERQSYYLAIIDNQKQYIDLLLPVLDKDLTLIQKKGNTVAIQLDGLFLSEASSDMDRQNRSQKIIDMRTALVQISKRLDEEHQKVVKDGHPSNVIGLTSVNSLISYGDAYCHYETTQGVFRYEEICLPSFYLTPLNGLEPFHPLTQLDKILMWNWSEQQHLTKMGKDIPFQELLALMNRYIAVYHRIIALPKNDRQVEWDISLDAPFVSSLY